MKSLSMRIAERALRENQPRRVNKAAFIIVQDDVKRALNNGWTVHAIWRTLCDEGKIAFSYQMFLIFVNRLIRERRSEFGAISAGTKATGSNSRLTSAGNLAPKTVDADAEQGWEAVPQIGGDQATNMAVIGGQSLLDAVKEFAHLVSRFPEETLFIVHVWVPSGTEPALLSH